MSLLSRINERIGKKSWTEEPFWSLDRPSNVFMTNAVSERETIGNDFIAYVEGAYKRNGTLFACMAARQMVFSEAKFLWRREEKGRPGDMFSDASLKLLENPWPGGTTGELLAHMIQDVDLAGNAFLTTTDDRGRFGKAATGPGRRIVRLRPDWVTMIMGSHSGDLMAIDTKVILYEYRPPGDGPVVHLVPDEVCHFSPIPDPTARFRGMSWITPVIRDIESDTLGTLHKKKFFENAAVPNLAVKFDKDVEEDEFDEFVDKFNTSHRGAMNAYKTLFLMGGADVEPLSHNFQQIEFNQTVGKGESRIAAAAGVPSSWVGFSEGMQGSALNAGNFAAARRRFADGTIRPLWRMAAASLQVLLDRPGGENSSVKLWYDDRDIAFLREDLKDRAEVFMTTIGAINTGTMAGFEADALVEAARDYDLEKLMGKHTGFTSVQMRPPPHEDYTEDRAERDGADLLNVQANSIATLAATGRFTEESIVAAIQAGDVSLLKPVPIPIDPATGLPVGQGGGGGSGGGGSGGGGRGATQPSAQPNKPDPGASAQAQDRSGDDLESDASRNERLNQISDG